MRPAPSPRVIFFTLLVCALTVAAIACSFDPIVGDDWLGLKWRRSGHGFADLGGVFDFNYRIANPRLGETLLYIVSGWKVLHVLISPVIMVGTVLALLVLALGRWPEPSRRRDSAYFLILLALVCVGVRSLGENFFYRPFECNYLFGFFLQVWLLVPVRLQSQRSRWWGAPGMALLGFAAGLSNEHTGPTLILAYAGLAIFLVRATRRVPPWLATGFLGVLAGYATLFFSPGLRTRSGGLGKQSILMRVWRRGLGGALEPFGNLLHEGRTTLELLAVLVVLALVLRRRLRDPGAGRPAAVALAGGAFLVTATLIASPMQGPRLTLAACLLVAGAAFAALLPFLQARYALLAAAVVAALVVGYHAVRLVEAQAQLGADYRRRFAILEAKRPPGQILYMSPTTYFHKPHWAVTDELVQDIWRRTHAQTYHARTIVLDTRDPNVLALAGISTDWMADTRFINQLADRQPAPIVVLPTVESFGAARAYADEWGPKLVARVIPRFHAVCHRALLPPGLSDGRVVCIERWSGDAASPLATRGPDGAFRVPAAAWPYAETYVTSLSGERTALVATIEGSEKVFRAPTPPGGQGVHLLLGCDQSCVVGAAF